jgi:hypothetical protein
MPEQTSQGLWDLELSVPDAPVTSYEWVPESDTLAIYSTAGWEYWQPLLDAYLPAQPVQLLPAVNAAAEIDKVMQAIVDIGGALPQGDRIVTAIPAKDGSHITLGLEPGTEGRMPSVEALRSALGAAVPLVVEPAADVQSATRLSSPSSTYWLGGNRMTTPAVEPGSGYACSTGFRIGNLADGTPGMLSAEHCGRGKPYTHWNYSGATNPPTAGHLGDFRGYLSSGTINSDTALWTGGNMAKLIPAIFTGGHNDVQTGQYIRGGTYPIVGADVCYTGALSGNVCANEVLFTGVTICYAVDQCYPGLTWTSQRDGTPAAGNGDSGGPVYQLTDGKAHAAGLISGIVNGTSTCTGDPSNPGRTCSPVALFAPVIAAIGSGGTWGLSYVP